MAVPGPSVDEVLLPIHIEWQEAHFTQEDPIIEYEDEFGRLRSARRSEVPRHLLHTEGPHVDIDEYVFRGNPRFCRVNILYALSEILSFVRICTVV